MIVKLMFEVWKVSPKSNVCVRSKSGIKATRIVLRRARLSLIKKGQWKKKWVAVSISWPQLHKEFIVSWKLYLNLCSLKWLRPSLSLVISLIPLGLRISKQNLGKSFEIKYFFLKVWNTLRNSKTGV